MGGRTLSSARGAVSVVDCGGVSYRFLRLAEYLDFFGGGLGHAHGASLGDALT